MKTREEIEAKLEELEEELENIEPWSDDDCQGWTQQWVHALKWVLGKEDGI